MHNTCCLVSIRPQPNASSQWGQVGGGALLQAGWGLEAQGCQQMVHLSGCLGDGRKAGLSTCPESLGCHQVPLILLPRRKVGKQVFPGPNPLHMGGHHEEPGPHCRHADHQSPTILAKDPSPRTCRLVTTGASAFLPELPHRPPSILSACPLPSMPCILLPEGN